MYNVDQWKIFKFLSSTLPKRESFKIGDIKDKMFKQAPNDRVVRNAIRKPVKEGHIEIGERGEYRLTQKGVSFFQKMEKENFKPGAVRAMAKPEKKAASKAAPAKKAAPKAEKKASAKPAAKVAKKVAPKAEKPVEAKSNGNGAKAEKPAAKKSSVKIPRPKTEAVSKSNGETKAESKPEVKEGATLSFA